MAWLEIPGKYSKEAIQARKKQETRWSFEKAQVVRPRGTKDWANVFGNSTELDDKAKTDIKTLYRALKDKEAGLTAVIRLVG